MPVDLTLTDFGTDTAAWQAAAAALTEGGGGTLHVPSGNYSISREVGPDGATVVQFPENSTIQGAGLGASVVNVGFEHLGPRPNPRPMRAVAFRSGFQCVGISFRGNYPAESFAFIDLANGNSMFDVSPGDAAIGRADNVLFDQVEIANIPGFIVGTCISDNLTMTRSLLRYCANGFNVSGRNIELSRSRLFWCEGMESANWTNFGDQEGGGNIRCIGNYFENCSVAASLGGNITEHDGGRGSVFRFEENVVRSPVHRMRSVVVVAPNAQNTRIAGNDIRGLADSAIVLTDGGVSATGPKATTIDNNTIRISKASSVTPRVVLDAGSAGTCHVVDNDYACPGFGILAANPNPSSLITVRRNRAAVSFPTGLGTGNLATIDYDASNVSA